MTYLAILIPIVTVIVGACIGMYLAEKLWKLFNDE